MKAKPIKTKLVMITLLFISDELMRKVLDRYLLSVRLGAMSLNKVNKLLNPNISE